jgi:hypothetical protein
MIYREPLPGEALTQGDILDDCPLLYWETPPDLGAEAQPRPVTARVRVVVLTQACDLAQGKATRVLVAIVHRAQHLVERGILKGQLIRDQIRSHRVYGWYFLPAAAVMEESLVDLRHLHTVPRLVLERLIGESKRVTSIATPYREHLAQHFAVTYSRIGLPSPYDTQAET